MKVKVKQVKELIKDKTVEFISLPKKINRFAKSGAYISISGEYSGYYAYVVVLKQGLKE